MERIKLNLIPSGVAPIVHLSQYDDGRQFGIDLFEGESVYVLDGTETLTVNSRKPDGHVVTLAVTNTGTSSVDVDTIEQLTTVHGVSYAKLQIEKGAVTIATLPFLIDVSRDPLENGDPSESFVHNLRTQIADGVAEEVAEQYDSSNVIFDNAPTSGHGTPYTVTSEGIKTAIDNAFDYDNTASGSLVHIEDGADNIPVKELKVNIDANLSGVSSVNVVDTPENKWSDLWTIDSGFRGTVAFNQLVHNGNFATNTNWGTIDGTYAQISISNNVLTMSIRQTSSEDWRYSVQQSNVFSESSHKYLLVGNVKGSISCSFKIELGGQAKAVIPITANTKTLISFVNSASTYNRTLLMYPTGENISANDTFELTNIMVIDLTAMFGSTIADYIYNLEQNQSGSGVAFFRNLYPDDYYAYDSGTSEFVGGANKVVYPISLGETLTQGGVLNVTTGLLTRTDTTTVQLTPVEVRTLLGNNNIFSNTGDVEVDYYTSKSNDILEFIDSEIGKKNGDNIPIEENSQDSIKDYVDDEISSTKDYVDNSINAPIKASEVHAFTSLVGTTWEEGCYYIKRNGLIIVHISLQGLTANARNDIFTLPTDCKPSNQIVGTGRGGSSYTAFAQASVTTSGQLQISSVDTYAKIHFMYYVDEQ